MTVRSCPWQYEWKRPQWNGVIASNNAVTNSVKGVPLSVTSAKLSQSEGLSLGIEDEDGLVLSITLYDSFQYQDEGDVLLLELLQQTKEGMVCLKERILHWPGLAVARQGVCSIALSRKPQESSTRAVDALDVLTRMSLGGLAVMESRSERASADPINPDETTELLLSCLTTDGQIYFYKPMLFLAAVEHKNIDMGMGLANLFLGGMLHQQIQESMVPLSQPIATTSLSVPLKRRKARPDSNSDQSLFTRLFSQVKDAPTKDHVWDASIWDANVEPSTTMYSTVENQAFRVESVFEYLAVLGKGQRIRRSTEGRRPRKVESMSTLSYDDTDRADDDEHETEKEGTFIGGFITFVSMTHFAEKRTVYLPFAPKAIYPVVWGDMSFAIVLENSGTKTLAIRVDSSQHYLVPCGGVPMSRKMSTRGTDAPTMCPIIRFHLIPVLLPVEDQLSLTSVQTMAVSTMMATPPSIAVMFSSRQGPEVDVAMTLHSLDCVDLADGFSSQKDMLSVVIRTKERNGHSAQIPVQIPGLALQYAWCRIGQGWSLVGIDRFVYFICWEGAMASSGAFLAQLFESDIPLISSGLHSAVLPLHPFPTKQTEFDFGIYEETEDAIELHLPFTASYEVPTPLKSQVVDKSKLDDIVGTALESISNLSYRDMEPSASPGAQARRRFMLTANEKSVRLLEHCKSWTMLDDEQIIMDRHVPVVLARLGGSQQNGVLSLRNIVVSSGGATPFNHVLAWLSQEQDYFTAASISLSLLRDVDSLRDLRKLGDDVDYDADHSNLEGLLDGIIPLYQTSSDENLTPLKPKHSVLTQVADMTLGCLLKGGLSMSVPLESFVQRDKNYDSARVCLMLVAVATRCLSGEIDTVNSAMGLGYDYEPDSANPNDLLWAIRALLRVGVSRDFLSPVLILLNATIGDELRRRRRGANATDPVPLMALSKALVTSIIASSPDAPILLLALADERSRKRFWPSLEHKMQLEYSLISVDNKSPLLRQLEVRTWALECLQDCIEKEYSGTATDLLDIIPTSWLKGISWACLCNAGCKVQVHCFNGNVPLFDGNEDTDGAKRHAQLVKASLSAMVTEPGLGGIDYNLLIPALLILEHRGVQWHDDAELSTQTLIDAACYLAGRYSKEEPLFTFDGPTLMRQCALSGNVVAGANLVGGRDALVLKCCDILIKGTEMTMSEAESFVIDDILTGATDGISTSFDLTDQHRKVLWLLDEHVLSVRTFGEFSSNAFRGKIDPVFAARACLRTWLRLNCSVESTDWLVAWLRRRLGIVDGAISHKRLACAAFVRALMWPTIDNPHKEIEPGSDQLLANTFRIESAFLVQLCRACCGLVEAVPPSMAEEAIRQYEVAQNTKYSGVTPIRRNVGILH